MQIDELKQLVKHSTAVLVLDNGEPSFAILNYETYKNLVLKEGGAQTEKEIKVHHSSSNGLDGSVGVQPGSLMNSQEINLNELEILERINKDILSLKAEIEKEEKTLNI